MMVMKELSSRRRILAACLVLATACIQGSASLASPDAEDRAEAILHQQYKNGTSARKEQNYQKMVDCYHKAIEEAKKLKPDNPSKKMYLQMMLSDYMYAEHQAKLREEYNRVAELLVDQLDILEILGKKGTPTYQTQSYEAAEFFNRVGRPIEAKKYMDMAKK